MLLPAVPLLTFNALEPIAVLKAVALLVFKASKPMAVLLSAPASCPVIIPAPASPPKRRVEGTWYTALPTVILLLTKRFLLNVTSPSTTKPLFKETSPLTDIFPFKERSSETMRS